jgi:hypothetical protein
LTILADKVGTGSRYPAPVGCAPILSIVGHNSEHFCRLVFLTRFSFVKNDKSKDWRVEEVSFCK